jgi:hypothetical protein
LYIISHKYDDPPGEAPIPYAICSGDPNCDCDINLVDILLLIDKVYFDPDELIDLCNCADWFVECGLPTGKSVKFNATSSNINKWEDIKAEYYR